MQFKKLILTTLVVLMSAQSAAFAFDIQTEVQKCLDYVPKSPKAMAGCALGAFGAAVVGAVSYCIYNEYRKKKSEKDFWNKKSDSKIVKLAEDFMCSAQDGLVEPIKSAGKCSIASLYLVRGAITTCQIWLKRLIDRSLFGCAQKMKDLESELIELRNSANIFVNDNFIQQFESLQNTVNNRPPLVIAFPPYPYGYNYCY